MAPVTIDIEGMAHGYRHIVDSVRLGGEEVSPRGEPTLEILNPTIVLADPTDALPVGCGRNINPRIAAVEAAQLCAGSARPDLMVAASPNFERYREKDGTFWGAYGTRIGNQAGEVVSKLQGDPSSRQAVVTLWNPTYDNDYGKLDYPCTIGFQFYIRGDRLHMTSIMRSNDVWLGLAYDLFQFAQLQCTVANMLGVEVGKLTHRPTSLHLYLRDVEKAAALHNPTTGHMPLGGFSSVATAYNILYGDEVEDPGLTERWFIETLGPLLEKVGNEQT